MLESAGLIRRKRSGRLIYVSAVPGALLEAGLLLDYYETFWRSALDNLSSYMEEPMSDTIQISRTISASVEGVYKAWTDPAHMTRWFTPAPDMTVRVDASVVTGGKFTIVMILGDGTELPHTGEYLAVEENKLLKFTWNSGDVTNSTVTVAFEARGSETLVTITHEGLPDEESRNNHRGGWTHILDCCAAAV